MVLDRSTKKLDSPEGGAVAPSKSDGKKENSLALLKQMAAAVVPTNIAERL